MQSSLGGIRVVDFTVAMAGPYCTMMLGDLGAEVIKVEPPQGDVTRSWAPPYIAGQSAYFLSVNRNKRSISVDLKDESNRERVRKLIASSDVVVENFKPGVMRKLGLDYESVRQLNERIIYCSISGFGQTGPRAEQPGFDLTILAMSGLMSITGEPERPPVKFGVPIADIVSGLHAAIAIVAAIRHRDRTGEGQYIDMSMLEANMSVLTHQAFSYFATGRDPEKHGSAHSSIAPYQVFRASDGYIAVAVGSEKQWSSFCRAIGREDLERDERFRTNPDRVRHREELVAELERVFITRDRQYWVSALMAASVPAAPVLNVSEAMHDEQVKAREVVGEIDAGYGRVPVISSPFRMSKTPGTVRLPPPLLGQDNELLEEVQ